MYIKCLRLIKKGNGLLLGVEIYFILKRRQKYKNLNMISEFYLTFLESQLILE